jgi:hypothetical protein
MGDERLFPISLVFFKKVIEPLILKHYKRPGRPPKISHYHFFCGVVYVLRTACLKKRGHSLLGEAAKG